jgi:uncharacterized protein
MSTIGTRMAISLSGPGVTSARSAVTKAVLRGYRIDLAAQISTPKLTFDWFDYVMRGAPKPSLVQDRIDFEVMGANRWEHAASLDRMTPSTVTFYLTNRRAGGSCYQLSPSAPAGSESPHESVDFADRKTTNNNDSYPDPILPKHPGLRSGYAFITAPLDRPIALGGTIRAVVDADYGLVLYQVQPDGKLFELSYFIRRASYARDMTRRRLLQPEASNRFLFRAPTSLAGSCKGQPGIVRARR